MPATAIASTGQSQSHETGIQPRSPTWVLDPTRHLLLPSGVCSNRKLESRAVARTRNLRLSYRHAACRSITMPNACPLEIYFEQGLWPHSETLFISLCFFHFFIMIRQLMILFIIASGLLYLKHFTKYPTNVNNVEMVII